jgi:ABC-type multidrug transport system ATPase subunit
MVRRYRQLRSGRAIEALNVPRLQVAPGEILAVVGPNGSGKSTLLETMAFLEPPDEGRVLLDDRDAWVNGESFAARRRCPMLLQRAVLFKTSVLKNVMYALRIRGMSRTDAQRRAMEVLRLVRLDSLAHRTHRELSGGERRRVALARLLALEPDTLLLDEPTAHVDLSNAQLIEEIIRHLHATAGMTVIVASHDLRQAQALADRVVTLLEGRLFCGTIDNLFSGTLKAAGGGFRFQAETGLVLDLTAAAIVPENGTCLEDSLDIPVRITVDAERLKVIPGKASDCHLRGRIESIRQHRDRCHVTVLLDTDHRITPHVSKAEYDRLGLNLGLQVGLRYADRAVHVVPVRS